MRILYAAGPGDVIKAHDNWKRGTPHPNEVALTYSGQFADYCREVGAQAHIISSNSQRQKVIDGAFTLEHRPKRFSSMRGIRYHLGQVLYGLGIMGTAIKSRAHAVVAHSDATHPFVLAPLRLLGIKVVPALHNTLWPAGSPPSGLVSRTILKLNGLFFRWFANATICVSPECKRQVSTISGTHAPIYDLRAQFYRQYFASVPPAPAHDQRPFRIACVTRIERNKGPFDVVAMAERIQQKRPGAVLWDICGDGPDMHMLKYLVGILGLTDIVTLHGWSSPQDVKAVLARSHACIVPTRSDFPEGLAKTAAEAILASRPLITSAVNPALEVLRPACLEARVDDVDSYVDCVLNLMDDEDLYERLRGVCSDLQPQFYDRSNGYAAALMNAIPKPQPTTA